MKKHLLVAVALSALISAFPAFAQSTGFGDGIPLQLAVKRIVPPGMEVELAAGVDGSKRVSWSEKSSWKEALEQGLQGSGYTYSVSGGKVTIAASPVQVASAPAAETAKPAAAPSRPQSNGSGNRRPSKPRSPSKPAAAAPTVNIPVVPGAGFVLIPESGPKQGGEGWQEFDGQPQAAEWVVASGQDLHAILEEWAAKSGWRLVWESEYTYSLTGAAVFRGDFVTASTELLRSMQDVRPVPTASFYQGNKVLVIANNGLDEAN